MNVKKSVSAIDSAAMRLRALALAAPEGALLGSEDEVVRDLGVSRVTARQAARLVEQEGALVVKRGKRGGYFAARPSLAIIEATVTTYLNALGLGLKHAGVIASALWVESLREAAAVADREAALSLVAEWLPIIEAVAPEAGIELIGRLEREMRAAVFKLIDGAYIELIFHINAAFSRQQVMGPNTITPEGQRIFAMKWKQAKLMELQAIADGNVLQAIASALHDRAVWEARKLTGLGA